MSKQTKLFKDSTLTTSFDEYRDAVDSGLASYGFGHRSDEELFNIKRTLFTMLYQETLNSGPSFDAEILFDSFVGDIKATFAELHPSLLLLQRDKE